MRIIRPALALFAGTSANNTVLAQPVTPTADGPGPAAYCSAAAGGFALRRDAA